MTRQKSKLIHEQVADQFNINLDNIEYKENTIPLPKDIIIKAVNSTFDELQNNNIKNISRSDNNNTIMIEFVPSEVVDTEIIDDNEFDKQKNPVDFEVNFNKKFISVLKKVINKHGDPNVNYHKAITIVSKCLDNTLTYQL